MTETKWTEKEWRNFKEILAILILLPLMLTGGASILGFIGSKALKGCVEHMHHTNQRIADGELVWRQGVITSGPIPASALERGQIERLRLENELLRKQLGENND